MFYSLECQPVQDKDNSTFKTSNYGLNNLTNPQLSKRGEYDYSPEDI